MAATLHTPRRKLTAPMVATRVGVATEKVHYWVRSGQITATNLATDPDGRPRYAIDVDDLAEFERRRQVVPDADQPTTRRRFGHVKH